MHYDTINLFAFGILGLAMASLWVFKGAVVWNGLLVVALALALGSGVMNGLGLVSGLLTGGAIYAYYRLPCSKTIHILLAILLASFTLALFGNLLPGFRDTALLTDVVLSAGAYPTSIFWSFDKPLAGLFLMGWGIDRLRGAAEWKRILPVSLGYFAICAGVMLIVALPIHAVGWAPKWRGITAVFAFGNLLFVCVPEEAFFRGIVQKKLADVFAARKHGQVLAIAIAALIFGVCHFAGGIGLMLTATVAGVFYGAAYQRTGRIEAAILVHFLLNLTHFGLFSYPALRAP